MSKTRKKIIIVLIGILIVIAYIKYDFRIPCIFFELTGLYCPGCGATRAIISLFNLNFYQAFRYNALIVTLLPFAIVYCTYKYIFKGKKKLPQWIWYVLLIIVILFGILRNIPLFSYLAPTQII